MWNGSSIHQVGQGAFPQLLRFSKPNIIPQAASFLPPNVIWISSCKTCITDRCKKIKVYRASHVHVQLSISLNTNYMIHDTSTTLSTCGPDFTIERKPLYFKRFTTARHKTCIFCNPTNYPGSIISVAHIGTYVRWPWFTEAVFTLFCITNEWTINVEHIME